MVTDPIGDFINRIKTASDVRKPHVEISYSRFVEHVAETLKKAGYIASVSKKGSAFHHSLELSLVYFDGTPRVHGVERISKPSRRIYQKYEDIRTYRSGFGNTVLSTPKGVLIDMEAKRLKVGGEVLFKIW